MPLDELPLVPWTERKIGFLMLGLRTGEVV